MKIGIDVSMSVNKGEGYLIMEFKKRELFQKGILNPETEVRFTAYWPEYDFLAGEIRLDTYCSAKDIWERYQDEKEGIDSFCGCSFDFPSDEYELLHLADSVSSYCGIE